MKTARLGGLAMGVTFLALALPAAAIQVCHDYTLYRLTGNDPRPIDSPEQQGCPASDVEALLSKRGYVSIEIAGVSPDEVQKRIRRGDVIIVGTDHSAYASADGRLDHFIQDPNHIGKKYDANALPRGPIQSQRGPAVGGLFLGDAYETFLGRRMGNPASSIRLWHPKRSYVKGACLAGPVRLAAERSEPTETGATLVAGVPYIVVGEGVCSLWDGQTDGCDSVYRYHSPLDGDEKKIWGQLELIDPSVHLCEAIEQQTGKPATYNPSHVYEAVVFGEGKPLRARVFDGGGYGDNHGAIEVSLYEAREVEGGSEVIPPGGTDLQGTTVNLASLAPGNLPQDGLAGFGIASIEADGAMPQVALAGPEMVLPSGMGRVIVVNGQDRRTSLTIRLARPARRFTLYAIGVRNGSSLPKWRVEAMDAAGRVVDTVGCDTWSLDAKPLEISVEARGLAAIRLVTDNRYGDSTWATYNCLPLAGFRVEP